MIFSEVHPFSKALEILREKGILATDLSSVELRELDAEIRGRAIFSARTMKVPYLERVQSVLEDFIGGKTNKATARLILKQELDALRYDPQTGFEDDAVTIPPAEAGTMRDLRSDRRLNLVLETNARVIGNRAAKLAGETDFNRYAFPCYELLRVATRRVPRGKKQLKSGLVDDPKNPDWPTRWQRAGGQFYGNGRMIARKDDVIWEALGSSQHFEDAMDVEVPPFAFNSGYGWREVRRDEAIALGAIEKDAKVEKAEEKGPVLGSVKKLDVEMLKRVRAGLQIEIEAGRARLRKTDPNSPLLRQVGPQIGGRE